MPELFTTAQCVSGRCVFRLAVEAMLIARELSDRANGLAEKQRANELLNEASRLLTEYRSIKDVGYDN